MKHQTPAAWLLTLVATFLFSTWANAQVQTPRHVTVNPNCDGFYEYLPQGYNSNETYPLIVFIHGLGELGNGTSQLPAVLNNGLPRLINNGQFPVSFTVNGQTHKFIVISPQFKQWPGPSDINAVINYAIQNYRVNVNRIYVTGLSMGGGVTWEYAGDPAYANRVAAVVPVCGASWPEMSRAQTIANHHIAVWATHNDADGVIPSYLTINYVDNINQCNASPAGKRSIWQSTSHDAWSKTYNPNYRENNLNIYEWMLQYQKGTGGNLPPNVNAGPHQNVVLPANSAILSGTATDPDGSIVSLAWSKVSGPSANIVSPHAANTTVNNLSQGSYIFKLTATDNNGASSFSLVNVTVTEPVITISAGTNQTITLPQNWVQLNGSVTPANIPVSYRWKQIEGPGTASFNNQNISNPVVSNLAAGTYKFRLRVYYNTTPSGDDDDDNSVATAFVYVTVQQAATANNPGRIEAENYSAMSGVQTEHTWDADGGLNVGWIDNGDWMNYLFNAPVGGVYTVKLRVATPNNGAQLHIKKQDGSLLTMVNIPNTGGYQSYQTISATVNLVQGIQTLQLASSANPGWNINWLEVVLSTPNIPPPTGSTKIEAEQYSAMQGVQTENTWDEGGGLNVGWIDNNDWMNYNYNAPLTGAYTLKLRIATPNSDAQLKVRKADGTVLALVNLPNTGGYQNWQTITATVSLQAGPQALRLESSKNDGWNINWLELSSSSLTKIEAEHYTNMSGIATENTWDAGGGQNVGWIDQWDWMDYSYTAPSSGTYTIHLRVASPNNGSQLRIQKLDGTVLATVNVPNTGGYQNWQTVTATVSLSAGTQTLRVMSVAWPGWNFNWMEIASASAAPASTTNRIEAENWYSMSGVSTEATADEGGGQNVGWIDTWDWMEYTYTAPAAGTYRIKFRIATPYIGAQLQVQEGSTVLGHLSLTNTGGYQIWQTVSTTITLSAGHRILRIASPGSAGWNINWLEIEGPVSDQSKTVYNQKEEETPSPLQLFPNPVAQDRVTLTVDNAYTGTMSVIITDLSGMPKKQMNFIKYNKGAMPFTLYTNDLKQGVHMLKVVMGGDMQSLQFIKQ